MVDYSFGRMKEFFPHNKVRKFQKDLMNDILYSLSKGKNTLINAPTGIGKTAGVLTPALYVQSDENKKRPKSEKIKIFFLTSRNTQHKIVLETVRRINQNKGKNITVANIVGKKHLCALDDVDSLYSSEFNEYCKSLRKDKKCVFYNNTYKDKTLSKTAVQVIEHLSSEPRTTEFVRSFCKDYILCPYEISCQMAKKADVIIADYNHIFNSSIREQLFEKINAQLENSIIIVDEAHNLPDRLRGMLSEVISDKTIEYAVREAKKFYVDVMDELRSLKEFFLTQRREINKLDKSKETLLSNDEILTYLSKYYDVDSLISDFIDFGDDIRKKQRKSFIGRIGDFLNLIDAYKDKREFITILKDNQDSTELEFFCTDPSLLSKEIIDNAYSTILMSATLKPLNMYADILGFSDPILKSYKNPFPDENRLTLIIPSTTTKYENRTEQEFKRITVHILRISRAVNGRIAVFFPSYYVMSRVTKFFLNLTKRPTFIEDRRMSKSEKSELISEFLSNDNSILFGVVGASFSEGIDLPNKLKAVVVVGLPLPPPNIKTKKLIEEYDRKFKQGFNYGYVIPAMNKVIQSAGRCIRSESDSGALIFLDKRYVYEIYRSLMPDEWKLIVSVDYEKILSDFFRESR